MFRLGITQRVEQVPDRDERRDCLDQEWTGLLQELGCLPIPIPNTIDDVAVLVEELALDGVILSGGNDLSVLPDGRNVSPERDANERRLLVIAAEKDIPLLGVCRGLQLMANHYGAALTRVSQHAGTRHRISVRVNPGLRLSDRGEVNSFHEYGLRAGQLGPDLIPVATAPDGSIEAIIHRSYRQAAIMWHPERDPKDALDRELIGEFFKVDKG